MNAIAFDTHAHVKRLVGAGMSEDQAEAVIDAVRQTADLPDLGHLATKADLRGETQALRSDLQLAKTDLRSEIQAAKTDLQSELQAAKTDLQSEVQAIRGELQTAKAELRGEIKAQKGELIWWIIATGVASTVAHLFIK